MAIIIFCYKYTCMAMALYLVNEICNLGLARAHIYFHLFLLFTLSSDENQTGGSKNSDYVIYFEII